MSAVKVMRVFAVADGMIPSVELVLAKPLAWLAARGDLEFELHVINDATAQVDLARWDVLLLMRACMPNALELARAAKARGVCVVYAIDDDFGAIDPATPLGRHYHENNGWETVERICSIADQVWAFSDTLKRKLLLCQARIVVPAAMAGIEKIEAAVATRMPRADGGLVIGYGASSTHAEDIERITAPLRRILDEMPGVRLELVGVRCESLMEHPGVRWFPALPSVDAYYAFVASRDWTCALAPLSRSEFNDAKTDNKYREYAALGVPAIYADAPPYWRSIIHDYNGVVARELEDWYDGLRHLLTDSASRRRMADNARRDVQERYSLPTVCAQYLNFLQSASRPARKILVYAAPIPTTDIDLIRPFGRLRAEGLIEWTLVSHGELPNPDQLRNADLLVVSRVHESGIDRLVKVARQEFDLPVVFCWDDDFFSIPESLGALARHHREPGNVASLQDILRDASLVRASTPKLVERTRQYTDRVVESPYGFDFEQLWNCGSRVSKPRVEIVVGFFGTASHGGSVDLLADALAEVAQRAPHVRFEFFGPHTPALARLPRVRFIDSVPTTEQSLRILHSLDWDIGLAPLEVNEFNRSKLPTKYRDYSACHIPGIYTRLEPYTAVVTDGGTGLIVDNNQADWVAAIMRLVDDDNLRRTIAANAHAHVRNALSLDQAVEGWRAVINQLIPFNDDPAELAVRQARRLESLELRTAHLVRQVEILRAASKSLLRAQIEPLPPAGTMRGRLRRRALLWLREMKGATPFARATVAMPSMSEEQQRRAAVFNDIGAERMVLGADLRGVPYVEYPLPAGRGRGTCVRLPTAALVPMLDGVLGIEIVDPSERIVAHLSIALEHLDPSQVAGFRLDEISIDRKGWRMRCFVRNASSPVHVLTWDGANAGKAGVVYWLESDTGGLEF